jgi:hypothetical protein
VRSDALDLAGRRSADRYVRTPNPLLRLSSLFPEHPNLLPGNQVSASGNRDALPRGGVLSGASIAAATLVSWRTGLIVALGIIAHDLSDGLNTMLLVTHGELAGKREYAFLFADALAPVLGGLLVLKVKISAQSMIVLLGLTSSFFCSRRLMTCCQKRTDDLPVLLCQLLPSVGFSSSR